MDRSPSFPFPVDERHRPTATDAVHRAAYRGAVSGADAYPATRSAIRVEGDTLRVGNRFVRLPRYREIAFIAAGHAAASQAFSVVHALGERITQGFVAGPDPIPGEVPFRSARVPRGPPGSRDGETAARTLLELAGGLEERDLLLLLISPGALASLALPPTGVSGAEFGRWLGDLASAGASSREVALVAASVAGGGADGALAGAAHGAEVVPIVLDRGDGGGLVGGSPARRLAVEERREARAVVARIGLDPSEAARTARGIEVRVDPAPALPESVGRPVVVASPSDALRGAGDAVGEKRYLPRLAELSYADRPAEAAVRFVARIEAILAAEPGLRRAGERDGVVVLAGATFGVPEGLDERPALVEFLNAAAGLVRYRDATLGAFATSGGEEPGRPHGLVTGVPSAGDRSPPELRGLAMRSGISDVGVVITAVLPTRPASFDR